MDITFTNDDPTNTLVIDIWRSKTLHQVQVISKFLDKVVTILLCLKPIPRVVLQFSTGCDSGTAVAESNGTKADRRTGQEKYYGS
jgi:hypothetical protein